MAKLIYSAITPAARILTARALNRTILARQHLLERATMSLPKLLERIGGIQAQYAPSMYVGVWSRLDGLERDDLTRALERKKVVQATLMRATIHLVSARDYWPFEIGVRDERQRWWLRLQRGAVTKSALDAAAKRMRPRLAEGPLNRAEMDELLGKDLARAFWMWIDLVRVPPSGTWERRRADLYASAEEWLGPPDTSPAEGVERIRARRGLSTRGAAREQTFSCTASYRARAFRLNTASSKQSPGRATGSAASPNPRKGRASTTSRGLARTRRGPRFASPS